MFKRLFVPTDGSKMSADNTDRAIRFAVEAGATITFFNVKPEFPMALYGEGALIDPTTPQQFADLAEQQSKSILSACVEKANAVGVNCDSRSATSGSIYHAIVAAADEANADLIFMASHGRRGLSSLLLGSETHKVLTHSTIPVLVFREPRSPK
jgi:nucleotide-binding universal stress UspA family protein